MIKYLIICTILCTAQVWDLYDAYNANGIACFHLILFTVLINEKQFPLGQFTLVTND